MSDEFLQIPWVHASAVFLAAAALALVLDLVVLRLVFKLVSRTKTVIDDEIARALRRPISISVLLIGLYFASSFLQLSQSNRGPLKSTLISLLVLIWSFAIAKVSSLTFRAFAQGADEGALIQPRAQPIFEIFSKLTLFAFGTYAVMLAWKVNLGAWLASAGIAGIAIGFAAKDSLSNLFAGIFMVADATFNVGDFVVLDGEIRGSITSIGFRSTRMLTLDDVEIVVPNSVMGNARIVNESGGPYKKARVSVKVECAYGSDADLVKKVLLKCAEGAQHVDSLPNPIVRFENFGGSGLVHKLLVWIEHPRYREAVVDDLNRRIYKAFAEAGIEIPYSKHDIYIKQSPN